MKGKALFGMLMAFSLGYIINASYTLALGEYAYAFKIYGVVSHVIIVSVIAISICREETGE